MLRIVDVVVEPLSVPLKEPFVIATGRIESTRAVLVDVVVEDEFGNVGAGLGEAAALPPVTKVDQPELLSALTKAATSLRGASFGGHRGLRDVVDGLDLDEVARAGVECAVMFAWADVLGVPLHRLLGTSPKNDPPRGFVVETDITIPIGAPLHMAALVVEWATQGFRCFKVKVGRSVDDGGFDGDVAAIDAIAAHASDIVGGARVRLDGNAGQTEVQARELFHRALENGLIVELLEQPTPRHDPMALAELSSSLPVPVVADESAGSFEDVDALADLGVSGVNLKLVKHGGVVEAARIGRLARRRGLALMAGAMVETRVGLSAMFHVVRALAPGRTAVDLDTAFLLDGDPFQGGYDVDGPRLRLLDEGPRRR